MIFTAQEDRLDPLRSFPARRSLGFFYLEVIRFLGYDIFDEYKVMGLSPYGDAAVYRDVFQSLYQLLPQGDYELSLGGLTRLHRVLAPRARGEPFT